MHPVSRAPQLTIHRTNTARHRLRHFFCSHAAADLQLEGLVAVRVEVAEAVEDAVEE